MAQVASVLNVLQIPILQLHLNQFRNVHATMDTSERWTHATHVPMCAQATITKQVSVQQMLIPHALVV